MRQAVMDHRKIFLLPFLLKFLLLPRLTLNAYVTQQILQKRDKRG